MNKSLDSTKKLNKRVLLLEGGIATLEKKNCSLNAGIATLEKEICSLNKSVDSLNANASKLRVFKARETLGEILKRVYEIIEIEHEEEKISGYGNILVYKSRIHPREHVSVEKKILLSVAVILGEKPVEAKGPFNLLRKFKRDRNDDIHRFPTKAEAIISVEDYCESSTSTSKKTRRMHLF